MRLAFMGTPDFAVPALHALHAAGHEIVAVYSQPPRPAGRGQALRPSPVQTAAEALGLPVRTPARLRTNVAEHDIFRSLELDAAIVAAYGLILPAAMLDTPRRGCLNIHASLLPRWRGAAPIQAAILAGDGESGVTIMQMDEGLDTGAMLLSDRIALTGRTTATSLHDDLAAMGARLVVSALADPSLVPRPQPEGGVTYAARLTREDGRIDWGHDAAAIDRQIRAMTPWPGSFTTVDGIVLKIGAAGLAGATVPPGTHPGTVLDNELTIACGRGALRITRLQRPGRGMMDADAFLRGQPVPPGTRLGT
ncbi:methionyl-tRNA formyltransferase [Gluconacetobacter johannae]|uniref:Methionyl-tRNA formyltransferase n=1 Tax=Gluconacetobacter johannae TaxID=112140 RepID=A0A7W4P3Y2_9PROT|nr:methionyl-tRNA formyltransferase [Gluconacetobacter johannae]MBB2174493.1 methionyl-tRNA formyltransferase [Gluconacetobacter johannae]